MYSDSTFDSELKLLTVYMMSYCDDRSSVSEHWTRFLWLLMTQHLWFIDIKSEQSSSHLVVLSHCHILNVGCWIDLLQLKPNVLIVTIIADCSASQQTI